MYSYYIHTHDSGTSRVQVIARVGFALEQGEFDAQELFRILPKVEEEFRALA